MSIALWPLLASEANADWRFSRRASFKGPKDGVSGRQQEVLEKLGSEAKDALESLAALASLTQGFPGADHPEGNRRPGVPSFGPVGSDRSGFPDPQHLCRCD